MAKEYCLVLTDEERDDLGEWGNVSMGVPSKWGCRGAQLIQNLAG